MPERHSSVGQERTERQLAAGKTLYGAVLGFLDGATYDGESDPDGPSTWAKGEFTRDGTRELIGALIGFRAAERNIEL